MAKQKLNTNGKNSGKSVAMTNGQTMSEYAAAYNARLNRGTLPIPDIPQNSLTTYDA